MRASSTVAGRTLNVLVKAAFANALPDDLLTDAISVGRAKELFTCGVRDDGPDRLARRRWIAGLARRMPGVANNVDHLWNRVMRRDLAS